MQAQKNGIVPSRRGHLRRVLASGRTTSRGTEQNAQTSNHICGSALSRAVRKVQTLAEAAIRSLVCSKVPKLLAGSVCCKVASDLAQVDQQGKRSMTSARQYHFNWQCAGKVSYESFLQAKRAWRTVRVNSKRSRYYGDADTWRSKFKSAMHPYKCRFCQKWHLGHGRK